LSSLEFQGDAKIVNAGLEAKAKAWTYEAKAIKIRCQGASRPWPGLEDYITAIEAEQVL